MQHARRTSIESTNAQSGSPVRGNISQVQNGLRSLPPPTPRASQQNGQHDRYYPASIDVEDNEDNEDDSTSCPLYHSRALSSPLTSFAPRPDPAGRPDSQRVVGYHSDCQHSASTNVNPQGIHTNRRRQLPPAPIANQSTENINRRTGELNEQLGLPPRQAFGRPQRRSMEGYLVSWEAHCDRLGGGPSLHGRESASFPLFRHLTLTIVKDQAASDLCFERSSMSIAGSPRVYCHRNTEWLAVIICCILDAYLVRPVDIYLLEVFCRFKENYCFGSCSSPLLLIKY